MEPVYPPPADDAVEGAQPITGPYAWICRMGGRLPWWPPPSTYYREADWRGREVVDLSAGMVTYTRKPDPELSDITTCQGLMWAFRKCGWSVTQCRLVFADPCNVGGEWFRAVGDEDLFLKMLGWADDLVAQQADQGWVRPKRTRRRRERGERPYRSPKRLLRAVEEFVAANPGANFNDIVRRSGLHRWEGAIDRARRDLIAAGRLRTEKGPRRATLHFAVADEPEFDDDEAADPYHIGEKMILAEFAAACRDILL